MLLARELIGRDEEVTFVLGELGTRTTDDSDGGSVVLAGAAGVGKSRLAREVADRLEAGGRIVHRHAATRAAASIPFGALLELVPAAPGMASQGDDRLEILRRVLARLARESNRAGPPVLLVDDAHLLDDASAALLREVDLHGRASLLVTVRSSEAAPGAITALWKDGRCARLDLRALSRTQTAALVALLFGGPVDDRAVERIWRVTMGNPLFVREVVLNAGRAGTVREHRGLWTWHGELRPDARLVDAVRTALGHAEGGVRDLVLVLAVAEAIPLALVEHLPEAEHLDEAERAGLVRVDHATGRVSLAHPIFGETLRAELPEREQRRVRARLAAAISKGGERPEAVVWASWLLDAGDPVDPALLRQGAAQAAVLCNYDLAARLAGAAFEGAADSADRLRGAVLLAFALNCQARWLEADALLTRLQPEPGPDDVRGRLALEHSRARFWGLDDVVGGVAVLRDWVAGMNDGVWRDVVVGDLADALNSAGHTSEAMELALPLLAEGNDDKVRLRAFDAISIDLAQQGEVARVQALANELLPVSIRLREEIPGAPFAVIVTQMFCHTIDGNLDAIDNIIGALGAVYAGGDDEARAFLLAAEGASSLLRGRVQTACDLLVQAIGLLESSGRTTRRSSVAIVLIEAAALCGNTELSSATLSELRASFRANEARQEPLVRRAAIWETAAREGAARGREEAMLVADWTAAHGFRWIEATCLHAALRLGAGRDVARRLARVAAGVDGPVAAHAVALGSAVSEGDGEAVLAVADRFSALGFELVAAELAAVAARLHRRAGDHPAAVRAAEIAARRWEHCEGARSPVLIDETGSGRALTTRERQIVQLAAAGRSNREIADELVLSIRTVEGHLARAYAKLGIEGREELAGVLRT